MTHRTRQLYTAPIAYTTTTESASQLSLSSSESLLNGKVSALSSASDIQPRILVIDSAAGCFCQDRAHPVLSSSKR